MVGKNFAGVIAFMKVASTQSFSAAARELRISVPAVSKSISRLEAQLDVRLLERTTHQVNLTREGRHFFENCFSSVDHVVKSAHELKAFACTEAGTVRISSTVGFGRKCIAPLLPTFCKRYPDIKIEFELTDRLVDFADGQYDLSIRNGRLVDSGIIARTLAPMRMIICAAPSYLERAGTPETIQDLRNHKIIGFRRAYSGKTYSWELAVDGELVRLPIPEHVVFDDVGLITMSAVAGIGIAQLANYQIDDLLESGQLVPLLTDTVAEGRAHYLCYRSRHNIPVRTRLFIDYLMSCFNSSEASRQYSVPLRQTTNQAH
ncbi:MULTISPECIES: LysR family transcriptional regulator [unclassified Pseudomonas]|uniref:LysR family transcriptional regulator n=1 Tax=unclassified Pseudomonas TaxID=196821 RepID=UPI0015B37AFF|nr:MULTISPECIES: LysR family transcriptional regulator [unclassified Pseudomonas]